MAERARLEDVLNYTPEEHFSAEEHALIRQHFADNHKLLAIIRKAMLPTISDPNLPIEQMENDVWLNGRKYDQIPNEEIKSIVVARQEAIKYVLGGLVRLKIMAAAKQETAEERNLRRQKDSAK